MSQIYTSLIQDRISESLTTILSLRDNFESLDASASAILYGLRGGGTLYTCGNGGSAAEALHFTEELVGRYRSNRKPLRAVCLNADPTTLTCIANDFGFSQIYARQVEAMVTDQDVLIVFSTSGESENIVNAAKLAREQGAIVIGLLGSGGGPCAKHCTHAVIVESDDSAHIQEAHQVVLHIFCEVIEQTIN